MGDHTGNKLATLILKKECELEMSMQNNKPQHEQFEKIQSLVSTYSQAIEYYQSVESDLYIDLNLRMQNLLTKPETLEMLDRETECKKKPNRNFEESIQNERTLKAASSKFISPDKIDQELIFKPEEIRNQGSPETRDSSLNFDCLNDASPVHKTHYEEQAFSRSTFWVKDVNSLLQEENTQGIQNEKVTQLEESEDNSNEFVFHRDDKRNRHGVSFKVWKDKRDGALLRPRRLKNTMNKKELHNELLNENNDDSEAQPRIFASKKVIQDYNDEEKEKQVMKAVEKDMHKQESSLKIRLLKRENMLTKKRKMNNSQNLSDSMLSSSLQKSVSDKEPSF